MKFEPDPQKRKMKQLGAAMRGAGWFILILQFTTLPHPKPPLIVGIVCVFYCLEKVVSAMDDYFDLGKDPKTERTDG